MLRLRVGDIAELEIARLIGSRGLCELRKPPRHEFSVGDLKFQFGFRRDDLTVRITRPSDTDSVVPVEVMITFSEGCLQLALVFRCDVRRCSA